MRNLLFTVMSAILMTPALGQGTISFANWSQLSGVEAYVNRSDDPSPAGRLGVGYWAQLYVGPINTPADSLVPVGVPVEFKNYTSGAPSGIVLGGTVVVPFLGGGYPAVVQMRAWSGVAGRTYETARATGWNYGQSGSITITLGNAGSTPTIPVPLWGLQPFTVLVPEPSIMALGILGFTVLLVARKRRSPVRITGSGGGRFDWARSSTGRH